MNIESLVSDFENEKNHFDCSKDALETNNKVLMPGRFYVLEYRPKDMESNKPLNMRPVILSLGMSKKDPEAFLCIDLCMIPRTARIRMVSATKKSLNKKSITPKTNRLDVMSIIKSS